MKFAKRLKQIMEEKELTQKNMADEIGVTRQAISQYVSGKTYPNTEVLSSICKYLNVSSDYLLGLTNIKTPDINIRSFCQVTGLTDIAIDILTGIQNGSFWHEEETNYIANKDSFFRVVNSLLSYEVIDFLMAYSIYVNECCKNSNIKEKMERWKAHSHDEFSIDPPTYREYVFFRMRDYSELLSDMIYRKIFYGGVLTKDDIYIRSPEEFEIIVKSEYAKEVEERKKYSDELKEE